VHLSLVLVVDDEPLVRMSISDQLADGGYQVREADTAVAALAELRGRQNISVVITDVRMPGDLDGLDLAAIIVREWPHIRVIVISGHACVGNPKLPPSANFVQKPFPLHRLLEHVRKP
jgi:DNA-binding NtrC family response regulator